MTFKREAWIGPRNEFWIQYKHTENDKALETYADFRAKGSYRYGSTDNATELVPALESLIADLTAVLELFKANNSVSVKELAVVVRPHREPVTPLQISSEALSKL